MIGRPLRSCWCILSGPVKTPLIRERPRASVVKNRVLFSWTHFFVWALRRLRLVVPSMVSLTLFGIFRIRLSMCLTLTRSRWSVDYFVSGDPWYGPEYGPECELR